MQLRTFEGDTMADALLAVKKELGGDAVILHTRTFARKSWMGLKKQEVVEITAGKGINVGNRPVKRPALASAARKAEGGKGQLTFETMRPDERAEMAPKNRPVTTAAAGAQLLQTPAASSAVMLNLSDEVGQLKAMVMELVKETRCQQAPQIKQELFDHYLGLIQNKVAEELAHDLLKDLQGKLRPDHIRNGEFVREKLAEQLEKMLPVSGPLVRTKRVGPHVVALIGPTGVGKTTTVAKLAANLKLRENKKVGLITIDTYRIAAVDQLRKYAEILNSQLAVVGSPDELKDAIARMNDCDFVLIDTAGRAPTDTLKLHELRNFLNSARPDEVHLVLSATADQECIESAIKHFGEVRVDKIIFTKLDEAVHVGVMLNVAKKVNKALSYVTTGQDVPDDIEVSQGRRLAQLIMGSTL